jgi:ABC-2 type transport system permease protein
MSAAANARSERLPLWRLEVLRLLRTKRWIALFGVYLFFGFLGPLTAAYMGEIVERFGGGVQVVVPDPVPADGITQYVSNAQQLGLLVVVVLAAGALAFDARPEIGVFLRTRAAGVGRIVVPKYAVVTAAACLAFLAGSAAAWYETEVLIGALPVGGMLLGIVLGWLYLALAVAVVALATALTSSVLSAVLLAIGVLVALPILGVVGVLQPWLPSQLVGALDGLARGADAGDYLRSVAVTIALTALALGAAVALARRREL